ncbi:hypothetical protein Dimus_004848, partial [Dionaea muscipula]
SVTLARLSSIYSSSLPESRLSFILIFFILRLLHFHPEASPSSSFISIGQPSATASPSSSFISIGQPSSSIISIGQPLATASHPKASPSSSFISIGHLLQSSPSAI